MNKKEKPSAPYHGIIFQAGHLLFAFLRFDYDYQVRELQALKE
ncbi:hypothetical protein [Treponema phagedenis]|nr:hypothetical protein [Treponema phagedenis]